MANLNGQLPKESAITSAAALVMPGNHGRRQAGEQYILEHQQPRHHGIALSG